MINSNAVFKSGNVSALFDVNITQWIMGDSRI
jgi:hypothetical protein